ncbi:MAG: 50S ribosomal protein L30 [Promethearchaeota archaeon]
MSTSPQGTEKPKFTTHQVAKFTPELIGKTVVAIRIRGLAKMRTSINDTLSMLRLNRVNIAVVLKLTKSIHGMLNKAKDYIAWGPVDQKTLTRLLKRRGRVEGNKPLTDEYLASRFRQCPNVRELASAIYHGNVLPRDVPGMKPVFRLHPPRGGHRGGIKRAYNAGGTLGFVGDYINRLLVKMS